MNYYLRCINCKREYKPDEVLYTCPVCGDRLGILEILFHYDEIRINRSAFRSGANIWQFQPLLPIGQLGYKTHLHVGGTPLYNFSDYRGLKNLSIKYEGGNPSGSFKDRASAIAVFKAIEEGYNSIFCASTGNAASSLSTIAAPTKLSTYIFLPATAPIAKLSQMYVHGANVIPIDGTYDQAFDISLEIGKQKEWYCRNSAINPYLLEGKKTCAMEIAVDSNWNLPDVVVVPVGDGTVISSFYKGFYDLLNVGLIEKIPKIIGVQAKGSNAVKQTFEKGEPFIPVDTDASTIADSISVGKPRDVLKACSYVNASGGFFVEVEDEKILEASLKMAKTFGVFGEPAGASALSGLDKLIDDDLIKEDESVCIIVSGNGLKDIKAVERFVNVEKIKPTVDSVLDYLNNG